MKKRLFVLVLAMIMMLEILPAQVFAATYTKDQIVEAALQLLYYNEGSYGSVNKNDNGAVSVGKIQWHGNRALNLLKTIVKKDTAAAKSILGDALYNEITTATSWSKRTVNAEEAAALKKLLTTDQGKAAQDALATKDVTNYINHGMNLGITNAAVLIYYADLENQGGSGMSKRVAKAAAATAGSYSAITLAIMHQAALDDSVAGDYPSRRKKTYNYCTKYDTGSSSAPTITTVNCGYYVTVPANYKLQCYETPTSTAKYRSIAAQSASYRLYCTQKLTLTDGSIRYFFEDGQGYKLYFIYTSSMSVSTVHNYTSKGTESAHPHRSYKKCGCGYIKYGDEIYDANCSTCNPTITVSWSDYAKKPVSIDDTDAILSRTLSVSGTSISNVTQVGITLYDGIASEVLTSKTEKPTPKDGVINMFYYVNDELGYTLEKNTRYTYQFQATINGETYYSPSYTFVTGPDQGYMVSFNANGGSCSAAPWKLPNGARYGALPTATRSGYTFEGWFTAASGGTEIFADDTADLTGSITLYAQWSHIHSYSGGKCTICGETDPDYIAFTDVAESDYFYDPVLWAAGEGITTGTTATTFAPTIDCTRGQVVTFLWRAAGEPEPSITSCSFQDVKPTDYFYKAVLWAVEKGVTTGYSATEFGPGDTCTRGQVVTFLWRNAGKPAAAASNPFTDVNGSQYYYAAILWALQHGITTGTSATTFDPDTNCTRGQIVTFLYRAHN